PAVDLPAGRSTSTRSSAEPNCCRVERELVIGDRQQRRTLRTIGRYRVINLNQGEDSRTQILHNPHLKIRQAALLCLDHQRSDVDWYEVANIRGCHIS